MRAQLVILVAVSVLIGGCAEEPVGGDVTAPTVSPAPSPSKSGLSAVEKFRRKYHAQYQRCLNATKKLTRELGDMNARLDVGISLNDYSTRVGDISVAANRAHVRRSDQRCRDDVVPSLKRGFRLYAQAYDRWNDCIFYSDYSCNTDDIIHELRSLWRKAHWAYQSGRDMLGVLRRLGA